MVRSSNILSQVAEVFDRIPQEAKTLRQYAPVIAIYKTKVSLLKAGILAGFQRTFIVQDHLISMDSSVYDGMTLWDCACKLMLEDSVLTDLVGKIQRCLVVHIPTCRSFRVTASTFELTSGQAVSDATTVSTVTLSLFSFLSHIVPASVFGDFSRKLWVPLAQKLIKAGGGYSAQLGDLETSLVQKSLIPHDVPRNLAEGWKKAHCNQMQSAISGNLAKVRSRLLVDVNRKSVHLPVSQLTESQFLPRVVSLEATVIAKEYLDPPSVSREIVSKVVALYCALRQPEFTDPNGTNPRNASLFFNDCLYFTVAFSLTERIDFSSEILLLRSAASRSMSAFLSAVSSRAIAHLTGASDRAWSQGLANNSQVSVAESSISHSIAELTACIREWKTLGVQAELISVWTLMALDPVIKEMNRLTVVCAKSAVSASKKAGGILMSSSSSPVISAIWSVYRKFVQLVQDEVLPSEESGDVLNSWAAAKAIRKALCGNQSDISSSEPLAQDEEQYGVARVGIDSLLACNPLLQGYSKESFKSFGDRLMLTVTDDIRTDPSRKVSASEKDFASLFSRA